MDFRILGLEAVRGFVRLQRLGVGFGDHEVLCIQALENSGCCQMTEPFYKYIEE